MSTEQAIEMVWGVPQWDSPGFVMIPKEFLENYAQAGLTADEAMLIIHLASFKFAVPGSTSHPSLSTLAERMGITKRMVRMKISSLRKKGLKVIERPGDTSIYDFTLIAHRCEKNFPGGKKISGGGRKKISSEEEEYNKKNNDSPGPEENFTPDPAQSDSPLVRRLTSLGLPKQKAEKLVMLYGTVHVAAVLNHLNSQKNIRNKAAWIQAALKEGWAVENQPEKPQSQGFNELSREIDSTLKPLDGHTVTISGTTYQVQNGFAFGPDGVIPPGELYALYQKKEVTVQ